MPVIVTPDKALNLGPSLESTADIVAPSHLSLIPGNSTVKEVVVIGLITSTVTAPGRFLDVTSLRVDSFLIFSLKTFNTIGDPKNQVVPITVGKLFAEIVIVLPSVKLSPLIPLPGFTITLTTNPFVKNTTKVEPVPDDDEV